MRNKIKLQDIIAIPLLFMGLGFEFLAVFIGSKYVNELVVMNYHIPRKKRVN